MYLHLQEGAALKKVKKIPALIVKMNNREYSHTKYMYIYKQIRVPQDKLFMSDLVALQVSL